MAVATQPARLTYEAYKAEGEFGGRYDIIDGIRIYMPTPTLRHQRIAGKILRRFQDDEVATGRGIAVAAPMDVVVERVPLLRSRQPDVLFVSHERLGNTSLDASHLLVAPELVVEIVSPSDQQRQARGQAAPGDVLFGKLSDYCEMGVDEAWIVRPDQRTVAVLRLSPQGAEPVAANGMGETVQSVTFADLSVAIADVFAV